MRKRGYRFPPPIVHRGRGRRLFPWIGARPCGLPVPCSWWCTELLPLPGLILLLGLLGPQNKRTLHPFLLLIYVLYVETRHSHPPSPTLLTLMPPLTFIRSSSSSAAHSSRPLGRPLRSLRVLAVASPHNLNLGGPHASAKNSPKGTSVASSSSSSRRDTNVAPARVAITSTATSHNKPLQATTTTNETTTTTTATTEAATTTSETTAETPSTSTSSSAASGVVAVDDVLAPVSDDMVQLDMSVRNIVGQRHPMLMAAADQIFGAGGKKLRPAVVFLVSRATMQLHGTSEMNAKHRKLAEIIEMIHTASLVHDDVLDECDLRRGAATVNQKYGTRLAVLAGDFLFAQSSWFLANLDNLEVIKLISRVIADFADGEIAQASSLFDTSITVEQYVDKSFYKTASLIAASCRSAAALSDVSDEVKEACYEYGRALGIAFQIVDDVLDFTQSTETLGKPRGQDLASGNLTAPAIFALQRDAEADGQLLDIIDSEFVEEDSLERALGYVEEFGGLDAARKLAEEYAQKARDSLSVLPDSASKESLNLLVDYVLCRVY